MDRTPRPANWNMRSPLPFPSTAQQLWRLSCIREAQSSTLLDEISTAIALAHASGRVKMVNIWGANWRANPHGSLTYCGVASAR